MSKEIKYLGSTKKDIWEAYKAVKEELEASTMSEPMSTTAKAKSDRITSSIATANNMNVSDIEVTMKSIVTDIITMKDEYDQLTEAINAKKAELKEVHQIEVSANDLAALAATKEKLVKDAEAKAIEIKTEADEYYKSVKNQVIEYKNEVSRDRKREEEQYKYNTERERMIAENQIQDMLDAKKKSLDSRESDIVTREENLEMKEKEIVDLKSKIENIESNIDLKIAIARDEAEEKAKKSYQYQANIIKANTDAQAKIYESKIQDLESKVADLKASLEAANELVGKSNNHVAEMAKSALAAHADAETITRVIETTGSNKSK